MEKWNPQKVIMRPVTILKCPKCDNSFSFKSLDGKEGWIVLDYREHPNMKGTVCDICGAKWEGRNLLVEQGFYYQVLPSEAMKKDGSWKWKDAWPLTPKDVESVGKSKKKQTLDKIPA